MQKKKKKKPPYRKKIQKRLAKQNKNAYNRLCKVANRPSIQESFTLIRIKRKMKAGKKWGRVW